jgi:hypothetical protein
MVHYDWLFTSTFSECSTGIYGVNCESRCGTCVNRICDRFDGRCKYGCIEGFNGDHCNLRWTFLIVFLYEYFRQLIYNTSTRLIAMFIRYRKSVIETKGAIRNWRHWQHLTHTTQDVLCLSLTIVCMYGGEIYFSHLKLLSWNCTGSW